MAWEESDERMARADADFQDAVQKLDAHLKHSDELLEGLRKASIEALESFQEIFNRPFLGRMKWLLLGR